MLFTSFGFIAFFLVFLIASRFSPKSLRPLVLFAFCIIFYLFNDLEHILAMGWVLVCAIIFSKQRWKIGVSLSLLPLIYFKYSEFLVVSVLSIENINFLFPQSIPPGISFVTFTAIAFIFSKTEPVTWTFDQKVVNPFNYLMFFPQVIAGPIVRPHELYAQLTFGVKLERQHLQLGMFLICVGVLKKIFIADQLGLLVDQSYSPTSQNITVGILLFPWQIYFDFSSYTDIALGLAYLLGVKLPINFNAPYSARSVTDFWRRWHMTLSTFFRDFVYKPLGGTRDGWAILVWSTLATFILSGIWHGANWNFVIWGLVNGMWVIVEKFLRIDRNTTIAYAILTHLILYSFWVVFRLTPDLMSNFFSFSAKSTSDFVDFPPVYVLLMLLVFYITHRFDTLEFTQKLSKKCHLIPLTTFTCVIVILATIAAGGQSQRFIYFDF